MNSHKPETAMIQKTTISIRTRHDQGFTLIEAMMAVVILSFGLISIANLSIVATTSNAVANRSAGATMIASQQMEVLRSTPFTTLVLGTGTAVRFVEGVGEYDVTWTVTQGPDLNQLFVTVRAEARGFRGRETRAEFTSMRNCTGGTLSGCPK